MKPIAVSKRKLVGHCTLSVNSYNANSTIYQHFLRHLSWSLITKSFSCEQVWHCAYLNSSPPSAAYMRQWIGSALVKIMACRLLGVSRYLNQCWVVVNWTFRNKLQWYFNQKSKLFIHENISENVVCEMAVILSIKLWRWLKKVWTWRQNPRRWTRTCDHGKILKVLKRLFNLMGTNSLVLSYEPVVYELFYLLLTTIVS